jgi:hypothetical protein
MSFEDTLAARLNLIRPSIAMFASFEKAHPLELTKDVDVLI